MQGLIIGNIANLYKIKLNNKIYSATARGRFKIDDTTPVVGDLVDIQIIDEEKCEAVIEKIHPRKSYMKRPKVANVSQIILVLSIKEPKPDLLMLDKQLAYAELYFTKVYWPDFDKDVVYDCLKEFESRQRRFGGA